MRIDGEELDLAQCEVKRFYREMDMRRSVLTRRMTVVVENGAPKSIVEVVRGSSARAARAGRYPYSVTPNTGPPKSPFRPIDADVRNADANYDEKFWELVQTDADVTQSCTRKSGF